jgi:hypothetical protein
MWRGLAFGGMGVGAAGLATGVGLYVGGLVMAGDLRTRIDDYNASAVRSSADKDAIDRDLQVLNAMDIGVITAGVVGAAALSGGVVAFFLGPDPGRYEE